LDRLSALVGQVLSFFQSTDTDPYVDIIVGITMIGVALLLMHKEGKKRGEEATADYKMIWIHGVAAAFGGDFIVVLLLALAVGVTFESNLTFLVGLILGVGSLLAQSIIVSLIYKGIVKSIGRDFSIMIRAGRLALLFLGFFMIGLVVYSFF